MDTNINSITDRFTHDTILYDDSELNDLISQLKSLHNLINSTIPAQSELCPKKNLSGLVKQRKSI